MRVVLGITTTALICFTSFNVLAEHSNWYVTADAGLAFQSETDWFIFGSDPFVGGPESWHREPAKFNTGYRADFHVGRRLTNGFSLELETGIVENTLANPEGIFFGDVQVVDLYQCPLLLNLCYETPRWHGLALSAGAGAGASAFMIDGTAPGDHENSFDASFALQGTAGVNYRICRNMNFGIVYKCLYAQEYDFRLGPGISNKLENLFNHSVALQLTWKL